jgi:hypothetical protein
MGYRQLTKDIVRASNLTLGSRIARRAIYLDVSVQELATMTGATRRTVYNWFRGGWMIPAYRERAARVYEILKDAASRDEALRRASKDLNVTW